MARLPRLSIGGHPHHVIQRGHNRAAVFIDDDDRRRYLHVLREVSTDCGVALHAYVLLPEEIQLLATPPQPQALSRMMQRLGRRYVAWFNRRHGRSGTLWEGRFRASVLDSARYLLPCMRYVETLPARRALVARPIDYRWSSAAHHLGILRDPLVVEHEMYWRLGNTPFERESAYAQLLERTLTAVEIEEIENASEKGWGLGLTATAGVSRRLQPLARGRPPTRGD